MMRVVAGWLAYCEWRSESAIRRGHAGESLSWATENGYAGHPYASQLQREWRRAGPVQSGWSARRGLAVPQERDATNRQRLVAAQPERTPSAGWRTIPRGAASRQQ